MATGQDGDTQTETDTNMTNSYDYQNMPLTIYADMLEDEGQDINDLREWSNQGAVMFTDTNYRASMVEMDGYWWQYHNMEILYENTSNSADGIPPWCADNRNGSFDDGAAIIMYESTYQFSYPVFIPSSPT